MNDSPFTTRVIKFAFIFLGSVGTILFFRWIVGPMLPITSTHPLLLQTFNFALGLFAFGLLVAAAVSAVAVVWVVLEGLRDRSRRH